MNIFHFKTGILFYLFIYLWLRSLQDLSSLIRDSTQATAVKAPSPKHWTTRELPGIVFLSHLGFLIRRQSSHVLCSQVFFVWMAKCS